MVSLSLLLCEPPSSSVKWVGPAGVSQTPLVKKHQLLVHHKPPAWTGPEKLSTQPRLLRDLYLVGNLGNIIAQGPSASEDCDFRTQISNQSPPFEILNSAHSCLLFSPKAIQWSQKTTAWEAGTWLCP